MEDGAVENDPPFELPQVPLAVYVAVQVGEVAPPPTPAQVQVQGPEPDTEEALPTEQRLEDGATEKAEPLEVQHAPVWVATYTVAEQLVLVPPFVPLQLQLQGPEPDMDAELPYKQRFAVGVAVNPDPFALPHVPLIAIYGL